MIVLKIIEVALSLIPHIPHPVQSDMPKDKSQGRKQFYAVRKGRKTGVFKSECVISRL
jgi:hypothetical protein